MSHIFISHSAKDAAVANSLVEFLEQQGHKCWIAPRDIAAGQDYTDVINDALENCHTLVFIMSSNSLESQWVKKEITAAMTLNKRVIPFKIARCQLSSGYIFMLNNVQIIDATNTTNSKFSLLLNELNGTPSKPEPTKTNNRGKWWLIAVAVLAVIGAVLFFALRNTTPSDNPTETPKDTSETLQTVLPDNTTTVALPAKTDNNTTSPNTTKNKQQTEKSTTTKPTAKNGTETQEDNKKVNNNEQQETSQEKESEKTNVQTKKDNATLNYEKRFNTAVSFYISKDYKTALSLFEELQRLNPSDRRPVSYINECKKMINQTGH